MDVAKILHGEMQTKLRRSPFFTKKVKQQRCKHDTYDLIIKTAYPCLLYVLKTTHPIEGVFYYTFCIINVGTRLKKSLQKAEITFHQSPK